jgi:hypothetical protein
VCVRLLFWGLCSVIVPFFLVQKRRRVYDKDPEFTGAPEPVKHLVKTSDNGAVVLCLVQNTPQESTTNTTMTKSRPFQAPPLSDETIQERLETGAHGSRASLTKCATRYRTFLETIHADEAEADAIAIEQSKQELEQELQLYQVEVHKMSLRLETAQQELTQLESARQETSTLIQEKQERIVALRSKQSRTKQVWGYKDEYEALAKMGNHRPSRAILEKRLFLTEKQMKVALAAEQATNTLVKLREKQFQLLMQCLLDLKASVNDNSDNQDDEEQEEEDEGLVPMDTTL